MVQNYIEKMFKRNIEQTIVNNSRCVRGNGISWLKENSTRACTVFFVCSYKYSLPFLKLLNQVVCRTQENSVELGDGQPKWGLYNKLILKNLFNLKPKLESDIWVKGEESNI